MVGGFEGVTLGTEVDGAFVGKLLEGIILGEEEMKGKVEGELVIGEYVG